MPEGTENCGQMLGMRTSHCRNHNDEPLKLPEIESLCEYKWIVNNRMVIDLIFLPVYGEA